MSSLFPAILIGGPPNRGKSVFVYILHQLLKKAQVPHYPLRATPDGGGNWFHETPYHLALQLRSEGKRKWNSQFEQAVERTLIKRPLPFLVDAGGKPTEKQRTLFGYCTHSIILGANEQELREWREICQEQQLQPIAEVRSVLEGEDMFLSKEPILKLELSHLERERTIVPNDLSEPWVQLAEHVAQIIGYKQSDMWQHHLKILPFDALPLNLDQSLKRYASNLSWWHTTMLAPLLADIPQEQAYALYGRAPTWIYSALALHTKKSCYCFDAQYGWRLPPTLQEHSEGSWQVTRKDNDTLGVTELAFTLNTTHLTYHDTLRGALPPVESDTIILSGKLPIWLYVALARHYGQKGKTIAIATPSLQAAVQINGEEVGRKIPWGK